MNITYKRIDSDTAREFADYILPVVAKAREFDDYMFYAMLDEGHIAGLLVADPIRIGPEILSIGLSPAYQKKGLAKELLSYTLEDMITMYDGSEGISPNYFGATIMADRKTAGTLSRIFEQCGFKPGFEGTFYETTVGSIDESELLHNQSVLKYLSEAEGMEHFRSLKDIPQKQLLVFGNYLVEKNISSGIIPEELEEDISIIGFNEDKIDTAILFFKENDGTIQNALLYRVNDGTLPTNLIRLLTKSAEIAYRKYPKDTRISFFAGDEIIRKMIIKFFPKAEPLQRMISYELPFDAEVYQQVMSDNI